MHAETTHTSENRTCTVPGTCINVNG